MTEHDRSSEEQREFWERIHSTRAEPEFRDFVLGQLNLRPDERVLSVGCGPGFETAALTERVGEDGSVTGTEVNEAVLDAARDRCAGLPQVSFQRGDVTDLPVEDGRYDFTISKQVLSEVSDADSALAELFRVLTPGGRVAVTARDRRTHVTHTPTKLLRRADEVYRSEMGDRQPGTRLVSLVPDAGLAIEDVVPRSKLQTEITDQVERGIEVQR